MIGYNGNNHVILWKVAIIIIMALLSDHVYALSPILQKKYPLLILTDDYGILSENDLTPYLKQHDYKYEKYSNEPNQGGGFNYWQCFQREQVLITLEDTGEPLELGYPKLGTIAHLTITVESKSNVSHVYWMRRGFSVRTFLAMFIKWQKLMRDEEFVCLAGSSGNRRIGSTHNNQKKEIYDWTFDKLKTKKGIYSYFT